MPPSGWHRSAGTSTTRSVPCGSRSDSRRVGTSLCSNVHRGCVVQLLTAQKGETFIYERAYPVIGACGVFMGLLWSCGGSVTPVELAGDSSTKDAHAGDATSEDVISSSDTNPNEASVGDATACHPKGCGLTGCSCATDSECCSGSCVDRACAELGIDLFCGHLVCTSPTQYCRITRGADSGAAYECVLMPDQCGTKVDSCECLRSHAPCGGTSSFVSCEVSPGDTITCE